MRVEEEFIARVQGSAFEIDPLFPKSAVLTFRPDPEEQPWVAYEEGRRLRDRPKGCDQL
jgi:hypothetical protein